ncbi:MAG: DEAD/DEAH box helicase [Acidimicrobiales bacterium]
MLADDLASALCASPGLTAGELAALLGAQPAVSAREVAFTLFADHRRFSCDRGEPARWWLVTGPSCAASAAAVPAVAAASVPTVPRLYPWQEEALEAWRRQGGQGVVEAVTGTGKTMVGVAAALAELRRRGQVLVLVPTVELQHQWVRALGGWLGADVAVGRLGDGAADTLMTHDVVVAVVNTARVADVRPIRRGGLLVADECHRYGSEHNRLALDSRFGQRLGLSATYARDDDGNLAWLDPYFGGTCYRLGYARAVADEVTARFTVAVVGVRLTDEERQRYDELSELLARLRARLIRCHGLPPDPFELFLRAVVALADSRAPGAKVAGTYRRTMLERRRLLGDTPAKVEAVARLAPAIALADRAIVFTHSISASERSAAALRARGLHAAALHSGLDAPDRRRVLAAFGAGDLDVIAAPRVLDEGIDVPAADLALVVGASRSRRQMVQRMGRVLRRKPDGRMARFAVVMVEGTVEDPASGSHQAFLDEVTDVADDVRYFPARRAAEEPGSVCDYLSPAWPSSIGAAASSAARKDGGSMAGCR